MDFNLEELFQSNIKALAPSDIEYLYRKVEQILYARYYGGASFPIDHPDYKDDKFKKFNSKVCGVVFGKNSSGIIDNIDHSKPIL